MQKPRLTVTYDDHCPTYTVYDRWGSIMIRTGSLRTADQFVKLAQKGISARVYYWLERWNYRVPKRFVDRG